MPHGRPRIDPLGNYILQWITVLGHADLNLKGVQLGHVLISTASAIRHHLPHDFFMLHHA